MEPEFRAKRRLTTPWGPGTTAILPPAKQVPSNMHTVLYSTESFNNSASFVLLAIQASWLPTKVWRCLYNRTWYVVIISCYVVPGEELVGEGARDAGGGGRQPRTRHQQQNHHKTPHVHNQHKLFKQSFQKDRVSSVINTRERAFVVSSGQRDTCSLIGAHSRTDRAPPTTPHNF
ncbi:unnamed protein product [Chrysodeixis includens]|uniref:Uncharacterized protein n=1 Tax=Chrysodeixis includens TaxID=689277 RepID=A0A9N8KSC8_CHRIL|nr:unnamed protein product [Chrysodeixis includens]